MGNMQLAGKAALVSGGGGAICRAISLAFAEAGASVAVCDIDGGSAGETARLINEIGGQAISRVCDAASETSTREAADAAHAAFGRLDILVSGAAPHDRGGKINEITVPDWQQVLDINLTGSFLLSRAVLPYMIAGGGGSIIFIASQLGRVGSGGRAGGLLRDKGSVDSTRQGHGRRPCRGQYPRQYAVAGRGREPADAKPLRVICRGQGQVGQQAPARPARPTRRDRSGGGVSRQR